MSSSYKNIFKSALLGFIIAGLFSGVFYVFAIPPSSPYSPGETTNPTCGPTDTNCTVTSSVPYTGATANVDIGPRNLKTRTISITGSTSGYVGFASPAVAGSTTYTLPPADGTANQVLSTDGVGALSWATASSGSLSGLTAAIDVNAIDNLNFAQTWNWSTANTHNPLTFGAAALTSGNLLSLSSTNVAHTGNSLLVTDASTGAFTNGGVRFNFTGAHTGNGVQIDDATLTGTALTVNANALTSGSGMSITSSYADGNSSNGLLYVANTGAVTNGVIARIQANSTTGSGLTVLASGNVGIGTTAPEFKTEIVGGGIASAVETTLLQIRSKTGSVGTGSTIAFANSVNVTSGAGRVELAAIRATTYGGSLQIRIGDSDGNIQNRVRIDEKGNVGIGDHSPTAVLHLKAGTATASTAPIKLTSGVLNTTAEAGAVEFLTDAYYGTISTGAARRTFAFLESPVFTGTVTIPTPFTLGATSVTSTGTQLNYLNAATGTTGTTSTNLVFSTSPTLVTPTFTTSATSPLLIGGTGTTSTLALRSTSGVGATGADIIFQTGNNGATEAMRILNSGNVGIGTTTPTAQLDVQSLLPGGSVSIAALGTRRIGQLNVASIDAFSSQNGGSISFSGEYNSVGNLQSTFGAIQGKKASGVDAESGGGLQFLTARSSDSVISVKMSIDSLGNVGIGTTEPNAILDVSTAGNINGIFNSTSGNGGYINFRRSAGSIGYLGNSAQLGIGTLDALELRANNNLFLTTSSGVLSMLSTGNVGIGISAPTDKLSVNGTVSSYFDASLYGIRGVFQHSGNSDGILSAGGLQIASQGTNNSANGSGDINFFTTTTNSAGNNVDATYLQRMKIKHDGFVGIGTTNPAQLLHLSSAASTTALRLDNTTVTTGKNWVVQSVASDGSFRITHTGVAEVMTMLPTTGMVGIGTTVPLTKLHVAGGSVAPSGELGGLIVAGSTSAMRLVMGVDNTSTMYSWIQSVENGVANRVLSLNPRGGNVAIGATTAHSPLTVIGDALFGVSDPGNIGAVRITTGGSSPISSRLAFGTDGTGWKFAISKNVGGAVSDLMTFLDSGKVGIGTTSPAEKLDVVGDIRTGTSGTNGCVQNFAGTGYAGTCSSDSSLKMDIKPIGSLLDKFIQINPVTYRWNELAKEKLGNDPTALNYGIIAQDIEKIFPELVTVSAKGFRQVDFQALGVYQMKAIQELVLQFEGLASSTAPLVNTTGEKTFVGKFFDRLVLWLGDATNGITKLFAKEINTEKLCVGATCVTEDQLKALLNASVIAPAPAPTPEPAPAPTTEPAPDPAPTTEPEPAPAPAPEPAPAS